VIESNSQAVGDTFSSAEVAGKDMAQDMEQLMWDIGESKCNHETLSEYHSRYGNAILALRFFTGNMTLANKGLNHNAFGDEYERWHVQIVVKIFVGCVTGLAFLAIAASGQDSTQLTNLCRSMAFILLLYTFWLAVTYAPLYEGLLNNGSHLCTATGTPQSFRSRAAALIGESVSELVSSPHACHSTTDTLLKEALTNVDQLVANTRHIISAQAGGLYHVVSCKNSGHLKNVLASALSVTEVLQQTTAGMVCTMAGKSISTAHKEFCRKTIPSAKGLVFNMALAAVLFFSALVAEFCCLRIVGR
jgi:hypothetical protein